MEHDPGLQRKNTPAKFGRSVNGLGSIIGSAVARLATGARFESGPRPNVFSGFSIFIGKR